MIELQAVGKKIRGVDVLSNISFEVRRGEVLGLWGVNGSGKTMVLRIIAGLVRPSEGVVRVNGCDVGSRDVLPESTGALIENPSFLPHFSGRENLRLLASIKHLIDADTVDEWLRAVGLDPCDKRPFRKYSLGMKQRLGVAAAFMERPDVVLLDEPTNALDPAGREMVRTLIGAARDRGASLVIACHDASFLNEVCDATLSLSEGKIAILPQAVRENA